MADDVLARLLDDAAGRLAGYGYLLTGSQPAGEELLQDAVAAAFARRRRLRDVRVAEGVVRATMRDIYLARVRRHRAQGLTDAAPNALGAALAVLAPQERAAIVLRHHDHLQVPEISAAMRASQATVERLLAAAHGKLQSTLGPIDPVLDPVPVVTKGAR